MTYKDFEKLYESISFFIQEVQCLNSIKGNSCYKYGFFDIYLCILGKYTNTIVINGHW